MKDKQNERDLTIRGIIIGLIGSTIITSSSVFIALKLSSLPWPIIFVVLVSMFSLKLMGGTSLNEINITHTAMSAGAMVAGGLAFTIPGIWIMMPDESKSIMQIMTISIVGTILGLIFTAVAREFFIDDNSLPFPMGEAAYDTMMAGDEGGKKAWLLFITMGIVAIFTIVRDVLHKIPATLMNKSMLKYGSMTGIWISPMLIGIGYIIGPILIGIWFLGAIIGDFGILFLGQKLGALDQMAAVAIKQSLGIGVMVGSGLGVLLKGILPKIKKASENKIKLKRRDEDILSLKYIGIILPLAAMALTFICHLSLTASILTIAGTYVMVYMSAECVGKTGINPMEIFGIIILLLVTAITKTGKTEAFYIAAVVAIATGLVGDVMNDFKVGKLVGTNPKKQWIGEVFGGILGAIVAVLTLMVIIKAYGNSAIGGNEFPAAQAVAVSKLVGGIAYKQIFIIGIIISFILTILNLPIMTLGLGIYLPFYLSMTAFLGAIIRLISDKINKKFADEKGLIIASGALGGEAVIGVITAIVLAFQAL